ncbi:hypothetical protein BKA00_003170 [Actinomadura coerulea]|uniref:Uncharacterized protein n=1 Tax=Actinomadura coerulea TaxID=46159 RepID=A0A7X0KZA3_9ACTN|nr:hypothetical protein [Actinomadura coerulea]
MFFFMGSTLRGGWRTSTGMKGSSGDVLADVSSFAVDAGGQAGGFEGDEGCAGGGAGYAVALGELLLAGERVARLEASGFDLVAEVRGDVLCARARLSVGVMGESADASADGDEPFGLQG